MSTERAASMRLVKFGSITLAALIIIVYVLARSFTYVQGPTIRIFEPADGAAIASSSVTIRGQADRINALSINGTAVSMDVTGHFEKTLIVFPGNNIITLIGSDQFKRNTERVLRLYGQSELPASTNPSAHSTSTEPHVIQAVSSTSTASTTR